MDRKLLGSIERWNYLFAAVFIVVASVAFEAPVALGVAVGAGLACANFFALHRLLDRALGEQRVKRRLALQLLIVAKMGVVLVLIFLALRFLPLSPVALAVGLSVFLLSIGAESIRFVLGQRADNGRA